MNRRWCGDDRGSAGVEAAVAVTGLLMVGFFIVGGLRVMNTGGDLAAGGIVTVDVTCTVALGDVVVAGFPGSRTATGHGVEQVDVVRGGA